MSYRHKKQMLILNINSPPCSYFRFSAKMVLLKVVHPLKICQNTKFHGPAFTDASVVFTSEI
jgi:hypothetical protein